MLWHGFCSVHKRFTMAQIDAARARYPGVRVIVHPECPMEVVDAADEAGSTDYIVKAIAGAARGQVFAIGTEINLVQRLADQYPEHTIFCLDPGDLPVLDDVPDSSGIPGVGAGGAGARGGAESDHGAGSGGGAGAGCAGADAGLEAGTRRSTRWRCGMSRSIVVGSGIAGLIAALETSRRHGHAGDEVEAVGGQHAVCAGRDCGGDV